MEGGAAETSICAASEWGAEKIKGENLAFLLFLFPASALLYLRECRAPSERRPLEVLGARRSDSRTRLLPRSGGGSVWVSVRQIRRRAATVVATFQNNHYLPALGTWPLVILAAMCDRFSPQIPSSPAAY